MIPISIMQVEYSSGNLGPTIHLFGRTKTGDPCRVDIDGFRPYFYIPIEEEKRVNKQIMSIERGEFTSIRGEKLLKIYVNNPMDVREHRDKFTHFEADIPFGTRFLIDRGITSGIEIPDTRVDYREVVPKEVFAPLKMCFLDIECSDANGFPTADKDPIISISCWDSYDDKYITFLNGPFIKDVSHEVILCRSEKDLLGRFIQYIKKSNPDLLGGWNLDKFDIPYINKRLEINHIPTDSIARLPGRSMPDRVRGRIVFDLLAAYKKILRSEIDSYRLDNVAFVELGERKVRFQGKLVDLLRNDPKTFVEYNKKDVELCVAINKKKKIIDFFYEISRYTGCPLDRTLWSSNIVDVVILRKSKQKFVLPSKGGKGEKYQGALVLSPSTGLKDNVITLDLKSLYPLIMVSLNMSIETLDPNGEYEASNGIRFKSSPDGLTREIINDLISQRDERKKTRNSYPYGSLEYETYDLQQEAMKIVINTYYGVSGNPSFRLYCRDIADAITSTGRSIIEFSKNEVEKMGYSVIYGDTDSMMIELGPKIADINKILELSKSIEKEVNSKYGDFAKTLGVQDHKFSIKFEKVYRTFLQTGKKKRYAGHLIWKEGSVTDTIDIVGFESRRSDVPMASKNLFKETIKMILMGESHSIIKSKIQKFISDYRKGLFSLDDIAIPSSITKPFSQYISKDAHIRGAIYSNKYLGTNFGSGSKPKRIYLKDVLDRNTYPMTDVLSFEYKEQVPSEFVVDYELMLSKTVRDPIMRVMEPLGFSWEDLDPSGRTLSDFGIS